MAIPCASDPNGLWISIVEHVLDAFDFIEHRLVLRVDDHSNVVMVEWNPCALPELRLLLWPQE